jgi:putative colanic acid biosynthesis acetyltransferase WcaF
MDDRCLYQDLSRFRLPAGFRGRSAGMVQLWWLVQSSLFALSPQPLYGWRSFLLRLFGARIGKNVRIRASSRVTYPWKLSIGSHVWVGDDCVLYNLGEIEIGSHVALAHHICLCTGLHDYSRIDFPISQKPVRIEDEVWICNDVFVGPGVTVHRGAILGARSTVLHEMPAGMICHGNPATPVKERRREELGQEKQGRVIRDEGRVVCRQ